MRHLTCSDCVRELPKLSHGARYRIEVRAQTESTNDDVRALAAKGAPEGTVVFAEEQTAGRRSAGQLVGGQTSARPAVFHTAPTFPRAGPLAEGDSPGSTRCVPRDRVLRFQSPPG